MPRRVIAPGRSCLECRRRKIKCDRSHPCAYCVKVRVECTYPPRRASNNGNDEVTSTERIRTLESKLKAVEKRLSEIEGPPRMRTSATTTLGRGRESQQLESREALRQSSVSASASHSHSVAAKSATLLTPQPTIDLSVLYPDPSTVALLWQKYLEVVDPLVKTFHIPSVQRLVVKAIRGRDNLDLIAQCLLFAIYYATIASISPAICRIEFEEERPALLKRYRTGVEYLLSQMDLRGSTNMTVLQAFTIYLTTGRCDEDGPDVYALVGLAVGMALKMGLNRDGEALGQSPFEVEMRRRLWWQLLILDTRVAEDHQSEPCILESSFNTRLPSNIASANLHPEMSRLAICGHGRTEMLFSLVRFEVSYFARQMVFSDVFGNANAYATLSTVQKILAIDLFQERVENQYLSHCDEGIPLDKITTQSTRLILAKLKLMATGFMDDISQNDRETSRRAWMNLLQDAEGLRGYEDGKQWLWLFQTYIEWDALLQLLLHLRDNPVGEDGDQGWETAYRVYWHWKGYKSAQRDERWKRIEQLRSEVLALRTQLAMA
ncbi:transcription factor domain-containing protein [Aspergillus undulatus]|uniref:transcription factor domain-containing protein n=1 Tax=Aspergillus undulatus TaxID=1810928 RepID=UPI003CCE518F